MDILCSGIIVVDHRQVAESRIPVTGRPPLRIVEKAVDLHFGGISILAVACRRMGLETGLMGCVGRDIAGYGLKSFLAQEQGVNVECVDYVDAPTSSSFIRLTPEQRFIEHTPGASTEWLPGKAELTFVAENKPILAAIGYAGLLPRLDAEGGKGMARWIAGLQSAGVIAALDTHTAPPYEMLKMPAGEADIFICNREEGFGITSLDNAQPHEILSEIWSKYPPRNPERPRLMGLTLPEGAQVAYGDGSGYTNRWITNPRYGNIKPFDLTGAGDYFRAGLYAYTANHLSEFSSRKMDIQHAVACAQYVAGRFLEDKTEDLPEFETIEELVKA